MERIRAQDHRLNELPRYGDISPPILLILTDLTKHCRFADDIELMTGQRPGIYWLICWKYLSPLAMLSILISSFVELITEGSSYEAWISSEGDTVKKPWPVWAVLLVLTLVLASVLWIPALAICRYNIYYNVMFIHRRQTCNRIY